MTRSDKWKKRPCVLRYWAFKDECALKGVKITGGTVELLFDIEMPKSWSKKKKSQMRLKPHTSRPDIDNMIKSVFDAMLEEDSHIHSVTASKRWNDTAGFYLVSH